MENVFQEVVFIITLAGKGVFSTPSLSKYRDNNSELNRAPWFDLWLGLKRIDSQKLYGTPKKKMTNLKVKNAIPEAVIHSQSSKLDRDAFRTLFWSWEVMFI